METMLIVSAAALIGEDGTVLVQQRSAHRSMAGLWEFPGGKIEPGETPEQALVRELHEELGIVARPEDCRPIGFASEALGDRQLLLLLYGLRCWHGNPSALDADAVRWVTVETLRTLAMPPADLPLIDMLARFMAPS